MERPELRNAIRLLTSIGAEYSIEWKGIVYRSKNKKKARIFRHPDIKQSQVQNMKPGDSYGWEIETERVHAARKRISFLPLALGWEQGEAVTEIIPIDEKTSIVQLKRMK